MRECLYPGVSMIIFMLEGKRHEKRTYDVSGPLTYRPFSGMFIPQHQRKERGRLGPAVYLGQ
jgi:hypothetical protein